MPAAALAEGIASGLVAAAVIYFVLRFDPRTVPGYVVAATLIDAAENAALDRNDGGVDVVRGHGGGERGGRVRGDALFQPAAGSHWWLTLRRLASTYG